MAQTLQSAVDVWFASIGTAPDYKTMHYWEGANQSEFDINFSGGYISREHVKAFIRNDTTGVANPVALTFLTASRVSVATPVPVGSTICIYRDTPKNAPLALFVDGAILNSVNLDRNAKQSVFAVAELLDRFDATNAMAEEAILRASEAKVAAAQAALDAASAESKVAIAQAAATSAEASAQSAAALAGTADTNASAALSVANGIDAKATQALSNSSQAVATAQDAEAVANAIDSKATTALSQSSAAVATANTALTTANAIEGKADKALQAAKPVLAVEWVPKRTAMWVGHVPADGQLLNRVDYPDAWAAIEAGAVPVVTEVMWLAGPSNRGAYTAGDGSTTFRVPDYNGKTSGSSGAVFLRGDGLNSAGTAGTIQGDAIRNITGSSNASGDWGLVTTTSKQSGAFYQGTETDSVNMAGSGIGSTSGRYLKFDASRVVPTAADNRPVNVTGCWAIRLFGVVQNPGQIDAATLATQLAVAQSRISELESWPQSGKTATTSWIKHRDGTMTATATLTYGTAVQLPAGTLFQSAEVVNIPLPAGFIAGPAYSISIEYVSGAVRPIPIPISSTTSTVSCVLQAGMSDSNVVCKYIVIAQGRWK